MQSVEQQLKDIKARRIKAMNKIGRFLYAIGCTKIWIEPKPGSEGCYRYCTLVRWWHPIVWVIVLITMLVLIVKGIGELYIGLRESFKVDSSSIYLSNEE